MKAANRPLSFKHRARLWANALILLILVTTSFMPLVTKANSESASAVDYCASVHREPSGRPLDSASPMPDTSKSCSITQRVALKDSVVPAMNRIEHKALMEQLHLGLLARIQASRTEALLVEQCFNEKSAASQNQELCASIKNKYREMTKVVPELRQHMSLMTRELLPQKENIANPLGTKLQPRISHPHFRISLDKLTPEELQKSEETYDSWIGGKNAVLDRPLTPAEEVARQKLVADKRAEEERKYKEMIQEHPFLAHMMAPDNSDRSIHAASRSMIDSTSDAIKKLDEMKRDPFGDDSLSLLSMQPLLQEAVQRNPELCVAANRMTEYAASRHAAAITIGAITTATGTLTCLALTPISWLGCLGSAASLSTGLEWQSARSNYHLKSDFFFSSITEDKNLLNIINDLDPAERDTLMMGFLTVFPFEPIVGVTLTKAPVAAKVAIRAGGAVPAAFNTVLKKIEHKYGLKSGELLNRIAQDIRKKHPDAP